MSRTKAAGVVWAAALAVVLGAIVVLAVALLPYVAELLTALEQAVTNLQAALAAADIPPAVRDRRPHCPQSIARRCRGHRQRRDRERGQIATIGILTTFLCAACSISSFRTGTGPGSGSSRRRATRTASGTPAGDNALGRVGGYLRGTTVLASIMAVSDYAFMWLLGVPLAVPLTILVFFSAYIPYFGGIVANLVLFGRHVRGAGRRDRRSPSLP